MKKNRNKKPLLVEAWVVNCGEFQGCGIYKSEESAQYVADSMNSFTHREWTVRKILVGVNKNESN